MQNEILTVKVQNDQQVVSARELYKGLELKKRFSAWVDQNFKDFENGQDYTSVLTGTVVGNGATKPIQDYLITIDMAKQLALMSRTEKGKVYRKYLIQVEKKWNDPQEVVKRGYAILQNENTTLKLENKNLSLALEEANKKVNYLDLILGTKDSLRITQIAADYAQSPIAFNKMLNKYHIQRRVNGQWILYREHMGRGYTDSKSADYVGRDGEYHTKMYTVWTQQGRRFIYEMLKKHGILPVIEREVEEI